MFFLYMIVLVSVMFSYYGVQLYSEYVERSVEEEIIEFEMKTQQDVQDLDTIITYMEILYGHAHSTVDVRGARSVHQQEFGSGLGQPKGERDSDGIIERQQLTTRSRHGSVDHRRHGSSWCVHHGHHEYEGEYILTQEPQEEFWQGSRCR